MMRKVAERELSVLLGVKGCRSIHSGIFNKLCDLKQEQGWGLIPHPQASISSQHDFSVTGLGTSDCNTAPCRRHILADSSID